MAQAEADNAVHQVGVLGNVLVGLLLISGDVGQSQFQSLEDVVGCAAGLPGGGA